MPIYEYSCPKCGEFEVTQRITEDALKKCPTCKSKVRKLISSTSFQLKGSGWYVTDYAKKGAGKDAAKDGTGSSAASDSTAKSDTASGSTEKSTEKKAEPAKSSKKDTAAKAA